MVDYFIEHFELIDHVPNWMDKLSDSEQHLIECMDKIYSIAKIRFESTAQDIFTIERNLHGTYLANERAKINLISKQFYHSNNYYKLINYFINFDCRLREAF